MAHDPQSPHRSEDPPALPPIALEVAALTRTPAPDIARLVHVIQRDPAVAATVIETANACPQVLGRTVDDLEQAVLLLGILPVTQLVLSCCATADSASPRAAGASTASQGTTDTNAELRRRAFHDHLTGLYNRHFFDEALDREHRRCTRYNESMGLLFLDLDRFKQINDAYGHRFGDEVLRQVAQAVRGSVRDCDVAARYGGEEFVVLVLRVTPEELTIVAERVRRAIETLALRCRDRSVPVTASVGAAVLHPAAEPNVTPADLLETADRAMYDAKRCGRNESHCVLCTADRRRQA
jgi:diguanylate cyclase (GGDEF)-like protein